MLLKSQKWEYSATYPAEVGYPERNFLDQIKRETCNMRYGKGDGEVDVYGGGLDYDAAFLPHWVEFADALAEHQHALKCLPKEAGSKFSLWSVELPLKIRNLLANALESTHFTSLHLGSNNFGRDGIKVALNYFENNPQLEKFRLYNNPINHEDDINQLCEIIKVHPAIKEIELDDCFDEEIDGDKILRSIMTAGENKLKSIDLCSNEIATGESTFIADFLATNPILKKLVLENNQLDDKDAKSIAEALKHNTNLRFLDIAENVDITNSGWDALRKAEFDSTSLNSAADSNHTCHIVIPTHQEGMNGDSETDDNFGQAAVRQKKIYHILSSRNRECSNVQDLDDVPTEFLPDLLRSIQKYSEYHLGENTPDGEMAPPRDDKDVDALSVVFELMRFWDKSFGLYESLSSG